MIPWMILSLLLLVAPTLTAGAEEVPAVNAPREYTVVATEDLRPLTTVTLGEESWILHLGPPWFWEGEDFRFVQGDTLIVHGEAVEMNGVTQLYPYKLRCGEEQIRLATDEGIPLWARGYRSMSPNAARGRGYRGGKGQHWGRRGAGGQS